MYPRMNSNSPAFPKPTASRYCRRVGFGAATTGLGGVLGNLSLLTVPPSGLWRHHKVLGLFVNFEAPLRRLSCQWR